MKRCACCKELKSKTLFYKNKHRIDGLVEYCKECSKDRNDKYNKTKGGVITRIYNSQLFNSKNRNHPLPSYTKDQLRNWILSQLKFHVLYDNWVKSGYEKDLKPSIDRKDDYKGYSLDNIQLMTFRENMEKGFKDCKNGLNNKRSRAVRQFNKDGLFIKEYHSINFAGRKTGISASNIGACCNKKLKSAGKYLWEFVK